MNESQLINQGISYELMKMMEQHAKQYDYVSDKKEFLKNVSPYEQKIILLNSTNPYEVLNYLDELDIKATKRILNELTYDEIKKVLNLFSSEDKKKFYTHYSDLSLVNQFIVYDENASEYIDDLTFSRKVDLIDSSNSKTVEATSKVYETMSEEQREIASDFVTESSAVSVLSEVETQVENSSYSEIGEDNNDLENNYVEPIVSEKIDEEIEEELEEQVEEKIEDQQQLEKEEQTIENKSEFKQNEQTTEQKETEIVLEGVEKVDSELETIDLFQQAKQKSEINMINKITNELINAQVKEEVFVNNENQKVI